MDSSHPISVLIQNLLEKIHQGITFTQMENGLVFILLLRFLILALRYNLKTSFYITCIGSIAGYFWYRHLLEIIFLYRYILIDLPVFHQLGLSSMKDLTSNDSPEISGNSQFPAMEKVAWYNPGILIYQGLKQGIRSTDPKTGISYYIDPFSMIISSLPAFLQTKILPWYYQLYNVLIPQVFNTCQKYWNEFSGVLIYVLMTRIGKKYCPYLIRWHWTCVILITILEQILVPIFQRMYFFQTQVILPSQNLNSNEFNQAFNFQSTALNVGINIWVYFHLVFIIFGFLHAICGQYFYLPFLTKNVELHVGPRPTDSIYSGGNTPWQNVSEAEKNTLGNLGSSIKSSSNWLSFFPTIFQKILKKIKKILNF